MTDSNVSHASPDDSPKQVKGRQTSAPNVLRVGSARSRVTQRREPRAPMGPGRTREPLSPARDARLAAAAKRWSHRVQRRTQSTARVVRRGHFRAPLLIRPPDAQTARMVGSSTAARARASNAHRGNSKDQTATRSALRALPGGGPRKAPQKEAPARHAPFARRATSARWWAAPQPGLRARRASSIPAPK